MADIVVSADIKALLQAANDAAARTEIGLGAADQPIFAGLKNDNGFPALEIAAGGSGDEVNWLKVAGAEAGAEPVLSAVGTDTDIDIILTPKGAGVVKAGGSQVLTAANNLSDVADVDTSRGNLVAAGTAAANTFTAQNIFNLAPRTVLTDLAATTALPVNTYWFKSISGDLGPLTFSGSPVDGDTIFLHLIVSGVRTVTFPSSLRNGEPTSAITSLLFPPGEYTLFWRRSNATWILSDSRGFLHNFAASTAPTANDDSADGYAVGSLWVNTTLKQSYVCVDSTATAAVWKRIDGSEVRTVGFTAEGTITTGKQKGFIVVPYAATITGWSIVVDAGTATVKVWKIAAGTAKPTIANVINTNGVAIATGTAIESTTLSDFTSVAVAAGDILAFDLTAVSGVAEITFQLKLSA